MAMENSTLAQIRDLTIGHKGNTLYAGVSFDICEGDCIMLCGANGSGKTTLMKSLTREGFIMIPARIPRVAGFTLLEFVRISCFSKSDMSGHLSPVQETALEHALHTLDLQELKGRDISTLSDGEFQKAGIASALVRDAKVIMLDEPTAFLDAENRISILKAIKGICDRTTDGHRPAVIFSTHDLHEAMKVCNKVFALGADARFHSCNSSDPEVIKETVDKIFHNNTL